MKIRTYLAFLLALLFAFPTAVSAEEYTSSALSGLTVKAAVNLGAPVRDVQILGSSVQTRRDGTTVVYGVTSGPPAILFVYNVDTEEVEDQQFLETSDGAKAKICYAADLGPDGVLNLATQGDALFFRYYPDTRELKSYGRVFGETAVMASGYADDYGNYYFGTYPNAKLIQYNKTQDKLIDFGTMLEGEKYINAVGGYDGKIFMGGRGNPVTQFVKYDTITGKKTVLKNPALAGAFTEDNVESYHAASSAGRYLFARVKVNVENKTSTYMCVFDMAKEEWLSFIPGTLNMHPTDFEDGLIYYHTHVGGGLAKLYAYDLDTDTSIMVEGIELTGSDYLVKPKFATLRDQAKYPGRTLVAGANGKGIVLINPEKKSVTYIKDPLPYQVTNIRTIQSGYNGDIIVSAYMGSKVVIYDSNSEKIRLEAPMEQIEDIAVFDDKYYFGRYGRDGSVDEFDPFAPEGTTPKNISTMNDVDQNRVFNIVNAGDSIIYGSYPNYGKRGGNVAVYNKATRKTTVFKKPVPEQAIAGLAYRDGKIYGSTSAYAGIGIDPIDDSAKLFRLDPATGQVEIVVDIVLTSDPAKQYFAGDMLFDEQGRLWVACTKTLVQVDPSTFEVLKEIPIGSGVSDLEKTRALPYRLEWGSDGLLYTNIGNLISAVDLTTYETKILSDSNSIGITLAENGNLYYIGSDVNYLWKLELQRDKAELPASPSEN